MLLSKYPHHMDPPFDSVINTTAELLHPVDLFGLRAGYHQDALGKTLASCFTNPHGYDAGLLVYPYQTSCHQVYIHRLGRMGICHTLRHGSANML